MAMSPEHKEKMRLGRERAKAEGRMGGKRSLPADLTETPEFKAAVAEAAREAAAEILAKLSAPSEVPRADAADDLQWARTLALEIGRVADQGTERKRIAPEILVAREEAGKRMEARLIEARRRGEVPIYQLRNKVQLPIGDKGEAIIEPLWHGNDRIHYPTEIEWGGVPNLAMIPINDVAVEIYAEFTAFIGSKVIEKDLDENLALTPGGVVVRGGAAAALFRATGSRAELAGPQTGRPDVAGIRRNQPSPTKDIRILGTIAPPARQNA